MVSLSISSPLLSPPLPSPPVNTNTSVILFNFARSFTAHVTISSSTHAHCHFSKLG